MCLCVWSEITEPVGSTISELVECVCVQSEILEPVGSTISELVECLCAVRDIRACRGYYL